MYLLLMVTVYIIAYFFLLNLFSLFFTGKLSRMSGKVGGSVLAIITTFIAMYALSVVVPNADIGNRILHAFGGGFTAMLICFCAARDSRIAINKFQFFVFSFLIVMTMGIANEIAECIGQNAGVFIFSTTINDTWFDLISNTVGALIGAACFVPFAKQAS